VNAPRRFRDLPLFWKFLLPSLALLIVIGSIGTFAVVRNLSDRAQASIDEQLQERSVEAKANLHDRELYLLESVNFASNVRGMDAALTADDERAVTTLLGSVLALKGDLALLVAADRNGRGVAQFLFPSPRAPRETSGRDWSAEPFVGAALRSNNGDRAAGFLRIEGHELLAIAGPVCSGARACRPAGVAIAGLDVSTLAAVATPGVAAGIADTPTAGIALYGLDGHLLSQAGSGTPTSVPLPALGRSRRATAAGYETEFTPFRVQGRPAGFLAVTIARAPAFDAVRATGTRLALIVLATMVGLVALMALLSRRILIQVRPLVAANRAFGEGELSARVPVKSRDELGELALGVNKMAEQLQASYETLEARVEERTREVQRLLEQRTEFFTALSHEFRTPLAVILSEANMLEDARKRVAIDEAKDVGRALRLSAEHVLNTINEILDIAQSDAGTIDVELEPIRLDEVMKELRPAIVGLGKGSGVRMSVAVPRGLSRVTADRALLKDVVLNLVENAVKYTHSGGSVDVRASQLNGVVRLAVEDSGVGIPSEVGDRIFEPFFRVPGTKPVRGQASNGLGLALAKRFVEAQRGTIDYQPRAEGGTVFTITLPRSPAGVTRRTAGSTPSQP